MDEATSPLGLRKGRDSSPRPLRSKISCMYLGYNTNGLAHHALSDAVRLVHEIGYRGIAITVDHGALDPFGPSFESELAKVKTLIQETGMRTVIETGARFLLDPNRKHHPTLLCVGSADRDRRIDFLCRAIDIAAALESDCVSFWSGHADDDAADYPDDDQLWHRLTTTLKPVIAHALKQGVAIGFEPEPGMFIDTMGQYAELLRRMGDDTDAIRLTLDVGHLHCLGEVPIAAQIARWADRIVNVHIEDMRAGVHEHLMFGEGEMDFPPILQALGQSGYEGGVYVELSRHSHCGPDAARQSFEFLDRLNDETK